MFEHTDENASAESHKQIQLEVIYNWIARLVEAGMCPLCISQAVFKGLEKGGADMDDIDELGEKIEAMQETHH